MEKQTYRQAIQKLQRESDVIYDKCGSLRDAATAEEKQFWNNLRAVLSRVNDIFNALDRTITDARGATPLNGTY